MIRACLGLLAGAYAPHFTSFAAVSDVVLLSICVAMLLLWAGRGAAAGFLLGRSVVAGVLVAMAVVVAANVVLTWLVARAYDAFDPGRDTPA